MTDVPGTEQEIDLKGYLNRVISRWWIVAICVVLGIAASFSLSTTDDKKLTRGTATVFLGQPISPNGSLVPNPLSSNPLYANALARQPAYQQPAARAAGLDADALQGHVSVELISTAVGVKGTAVPLAQVIVQGPFTPAQSATAANALAKAIVDEANRYTNAKKVSATAARDRLRERVETLGSQANETQAQINDLMTSNLPAAELASMTTPLLGILQYSSNTEALLAQQLPGLEAQVEYIENVEAGRIITAAKGTKVAPASKQFSLLVAIALGFVVGILLAIISTIIWPVRPVPATEAPRTP